MIHLSGLVVQNLGSLYLVQVKDTIYQCKLKGNFKINNLNITNPIAVGDYVKIELPKEKEQKEYHSWIIEIFPRKNYIIRKSSNLSKQAHIIGANLDRSLLIVTINYPVTSTTFIDRYLATAEAYKVETAIVFNKIDRYQVQETLVLNKLIEIYESIGYKCFSVSSLKGIGLTDVKKYISEGVTLISGHSGVGKSTFINAIVPDINLKTQELSKVHQLGVHTTTNSIMIPLGINDAYLIDTPGIKGFGTIDFKREEVGHYFPEIFRVSKDCYFNNCTHVHEPHCAVITAVNERIIACSRYKSYLSILNDEKEGKYRI